MEKYLIKIFGINWKTSLIGLVSGGSIIVQDLLDRGVTNLSRIVFAIFVYLLGHFAKDK